MSNISNFTLTDFSSAPAARVSYTLNNTQPVVCSYIGQEPLFYFDQDITAEEEYASSEFNAEFETFNKEIDALDRLSAQYRTSVNDYIEQFQQAKNSITGQDRYQSNSFAHIDDLLTALSQSRSIQAYIEHAEQYNIEIVFDATVEHGHYDREHGRIAINPSLDQGQQVLVALRELRCHWQHRSGALINPITFNPDNAILVNRLQRADLITAMIRGAWELKLAGYETPWQTASNSSYSDIARAFAREAHMNFRTIGSGFASTAAFEAWFLSERCRATDKALIRSMLNDNQGYVFGADTQLASVTPSIIAALGTQPLGKNYLVAHVNTLMNDPIFTDVRDRSNANFLWFIKFERSFGETERNLQNQSASNAGNSFGAPQTTQDQSDEEKIVVLYNETNQPQSNPGHAALGSETRNDQHATAQIVYLRSEPRGHA